MGGPGSIKSDSDTAKAVVQTPFTKYEDLKKAVLAIIPEAEIDDFGGQIVIYTGILKGEKGKADADKLKSVVALFPNASTEGDELSDEVAIFTTLAVITAEGDLGTFTIKEDEDKGCDGGPCCQH